MKTTTKLTTLALLSTLCFATLVKAEDITLPVITKPAILEEGTQRELTPAQIAELFPWAKDSKIFLLDLLDNIQGMNAEDKIERLVDGIKQVVGESAPENSELLMRYALNRGLVITDILNVETTVDAVGTADAKIRVLQSSVLMAIKYYDIDMATLTKKTAAPFVTFGVDYFEFLNELNKSVFDASAQYMIQRATLEWLQWDLYRDLNNAKYAPQIVKINNALKTFPNKKLKDSQSIIFIRQMKLVQQQLKMREIIEKLHRDELLAKAKNEEERKKILEKQAGSIVTAEMVNTDIKPGTEVLLRNTSGEYRVGEVNAVYTDKKVKITYYHNGSKNEIYKKIDEISHKVTCVVSACIGENVFLKNDSGEDRFGVLANAFANGMTVVDYVYNVGSNVVYRNQRDIEKSLASSKGFEPGQVVYLFNTGGEAMVGTLVRVGEKRAIVNYVYNGSSNELYKNLSDISKATKCLSNICVGDKVHLYNDSNEDRDGVVVYVFENGKVLVDYVYNGWTNTVFRDISKVYKQL